MKIKIRKRIEFPELFDILTRENIVVTFLSLLDMSKNKEIVLQGAGKTKLNVYYNKPIKEILLDGNAVKFYTDRDGVVTLYVNLKVKSTIKIK